ncbi:MAG: NAD(+)/NADH kinase [Candidatus Aenigmarchaeota archaeon]|nr:NAD(+)/NADH kinase [Candidatus Aenigmarchaeota archaeon]
MKIAFFGSKDDEFIDQLAKKYNFEIVQKNPNAVVCIKGDGTILFAEGMLPGIPKLTIRNKNHIGNKCIYDIEEIDEVFSKFMQKKYTIKKHSKIQCVFKNHKINALNEIQLHNIITTKALRFSILARENNKILFEEKNIIGDGCIFSTPFGSSGYFTSVGGKKFEKGLGVGLNNPFNRNEKAFYFNEKVVFEFSLDRGSAYLLYDNNPKTSIIKENEKVVLSRSDEYFNEIHVE